MMRLVGAALCVAACGGSAPAPAIQNCPAPPTKTCKSVVEKAARIAGESERDTTGTIGRCAREEWSVAVRECVDAAATKQALQACGKQYALKGGLFEGEGDLGEAIAKMTLFRDQMCACKDSACAQRVADDMTKWGQDEAKSNHPVPRMSEEQTKQFTMIGEDMGKCMQKAMTP